MSQLEILQLRLRSLRLPTAARLSGELVAKAQQANWSLEEFFSPKVASKSVCPSDLTAHPICFRAVLIIDDPE